MIHISQRTIPKRKEYFIGIFLPFVLLTYLPFAFTIAPPISLFHLQLLLLLLLLLTVVRNRLIFLSERSILESAQELLVAV